MIPDLEKILFQSTVKTNIDFSSDSRKSVRKVIMQ